MRTSFYRIDRPVTIPLAEAESRLWETRIAVADGSAPAESICHALDQLERSTQAEIQRLMRALEEARQEVARA